MNTEDRRTLVAAQILAGSNLSVSGAVFRADDLLAHLAKTAGEHPDETMPERLDAPEHGCKHCFPTGDCPPDCIARNHIPDPVTVREQREAAIASIQDLTAQLAIRDLELERIGKVLDGQLLAPAPRGLGYVARVFEVVRKAANAMPPVSSEEWIGVDLDGTLATYDHWKGAAHIGEPVPAMVTRVQRWLDEGREVKIFTARVSHDGTPKRTAEAQIAAAAISSWSKRHLGKALPITCVKDYAMLELWDDRAVQVHKNTGQPVGTSTRGLA